MPVRAVAYAKDPIGTIGRGLDNLHKGFDALVDAGKHALTQLGHKINDVCHTCAKIVQTVNKKAHELAKNTVRWVAQHKAQIVGTLVTVGVGVGCGLLLGWTGVGAVACGGIAGFAGSFASGLVAGKSLGQATMDGVVGGLTGALGGAIGGALVGKVANGLLGEGGSALARIGANALDGVVAGAVTGAGAGAYGSALSCGLACSAKMNCFWGGLASAAGSGALSGAIAGAAFGGAFGALAGAAGGVRPKTSVKAGGACACAGRSRALFLISVKPFVASRATGADGGLFPRVDCAAVMLTDAEHALTRDCRGKGIRTKRLDAGLSFREVVAAKLWNYRSIGQQLYGDPSYFNESIKGVLAYCRTNFPHLGV